MKLNRFNEDEIPLSIDLALVVKILVSKCKLVFYRANPERTKTDGANSEFSGARWRPRTGDFTTYTVLSFEAS